MTIGRGETNRYIIIGPGTKQFESRNPGALFVALSNAKTADGEYPDFAWLPDVLVNEDCLCHRANTVITKARHQNSIYQTAWMCKLVCPFPVCKPPKTGVLMPQPIYLSVQACTDPGSFLQKRVPGLSDRKRFSFGSLSPQLTF